MTSTKLLLSTWFICVLFSATHVLSEGQTNVRTVPLRVVYKGEATLWCDEFNDHLRPRQDKEDDDDDDDEGYDREEEEKRLKLEKEFASEDEQVRDSEWKDFAFYKKITEIRKPENGSEEEKIVRIEKIEEDDEKYFIYQSENKLTIKNLRRADIIGVEYFCNTSVNSSHINFKTLIKPFLMNPEKTSATVMRDENAELACKLLYGSENNQKVVWIWERNGENLAENDTIILETDEEENISKLLLRNVTEEMKGEYKCIAKNKFGIAENTLKLRVKNPWAPIWPVFGIILQLIILVIVISVCSRTEKRRRLPSS